MRAQACNDKQFGCEAPFHELIDAEYRLLYQDADHLLYTLRFEPRAAIEAYEPSGRVWVDTKDFVILRQEIMFRQSPVPLFLKAIPRMVVERTRAGDFWVMSRLLVRMELTVPLPKFGRSFDFGMAFSDYTVNTGLPDSLFAESGRHGDGTHVRVRVRGGRGTHSEDGSTRSRDGSTHTKDESTNSTSGATLPEDASARPRDESSHAKAEPGRKS